MKKTWQQLVKESLTKTRKDRYADMAKAHRVGYWIFLIVGLALMFWIWNAK